MIGGTQSERQQLRNLLRQLRKDAGLRQVDLAARLGKPQSFISKYESGEKTLDFLEVKAVCNAIGVSLETFSKKLEESR